MVGCERPDPCAVGFGVKKSLSGWLATIRRTSSRLRARTVEREVRDSHVRCAHPGEGERA